VPPCTGARDSRFAQHILEPRCGLLKRPPGPRQCSLWVVANEPLQLLKQFTLFGCERPHHPIRSAARTVRHCKVVPLVGSPRLQPKRFHSIQLEHMNRLDLHADVLVKRAHSENHCRWINAMV